jgi:hypothetical protein
VLETPKVIWTVKEIATVNETVKEIQTVSVMV